jgi:hypothetical protein
MVDGRVEGMSNVPYDLVTVLSRIGQGIDALDTSIEDAQKENDRELLTAFEHIRQDDVRHCELLRGIIFEKGKHRPLA